MATGDLPRHHGEVESQNIENANKNRANSHTGQLMNLIKNFDANNTEHAKRHK